MKVSLIVPVYNAEKYLHKCMDSIVSQTLQDVEVVCVDDGSCDNSLEILKSYAAMDTRIKILTQKNEGAGAARNKGMSVARGEYLAFLDADDFCKPVMLEKMYITAKEAQLDILISYSYSYDHVSRRSKLRPSIVSKYLPSHTIFSGRDISKYLFNFCIPWAWNKLFRRSFIEQYQLKFLHSRQGEDSFFVFFALINACRVSVIRDAFIYYRRNTGDSLTQTTHMAPLAFAEALIAINERLHVQNVYKFYEQSFINYMLEVSIGNFQRLINNHEAFKVLAYLKNKLFKEYALCSFPEDYFYSVSTYSYFLRIQKAHVFPLKLGGMFATDAGIVLKLLFFRIYIKNNNIGEHHVA